MLEQVPTCSRYQRALLKRFLIGPIARLRGDIHRQTMDLDGRPVPTRGVLEFHQLANDFNRLLRVLKRQKEALEALSLTDELTQLHNRRAMESFWSNISNHAVRNREPLSVIMIDIDFFKRFNDHYGHQAGDICLQTVAQTIEDALPRTTDFVARYGGEEFIAILPNTDEKGGLQVANRILQAVQSQRLHHELSNFGIITVSLGIASCESDHAHCIEALLKRADENLYRAKDQGRNRIGSTPP